MSKNKSKKVIIALISVLTAIAIFLVGSMSLIIATDGKIFNKLKSINDEKSTVIFEQSYSLSDFNSLKLDASVADLTFNRSDDNNVKITVCGNKNDKFSAEIKNKTLLLDETYGKVTFNWNFHAKGADFYGIKINIALPKNFNYPITADIETGDVNFKTPYASKLNVDINTGDFNAVALGGKFDICIDTGDVTINTAYPAADSSIQTDMGDVDIDSVSNTNIIGEADTGDEDINGSDKGANVTLKITTDTGDIEVNDD